MEGGRVRIWDWLMPIAGLALAVGLFMPWYRSNEENWTGWQSFTFIKLVLLATALLALAVPLVAALKATDKQTQSLLVVLAVLGFLSVAFTILRMVHTTEPDVFDTPVTLMAGAYLSLVASLTIFLSALLGMRARLARRARV